jgi:serine/threonine protein kinase
VAILCIQIGSYTDPKCFAIIMSPVADSNMSAYMSLATDSADKRSTLRTFFGCLTNGLQYLHGLKIRHRDIKPENILVQGDRVLLSDFGIALDWEHLSRSTTTADCAKSPVYCAPEVAQYQKRNSSSDIWSLGCVFLEMVTVLKGKTVEAMRTYFKDRNDHYRFYGNIDTSKEWIEMLRHLGSDMDNEPLNWVGRMLDQNPESRPTALALFADINCTLVDASVLFCRSCCRQDEDSSDGFDEDGEDGELWADKSEHKTSGTNSSASEPEPICQSIPAAAPSHSPALLLADETDGDDAANDTIRESEEIHNQGFLYAEEGKLTEAEASLKQALARREKALGPDHMSTLHTVHILGGVYRDQGRLTEAEATLKRALDGREKTMGPDHMSTMNTVHLLGTVYLRQGKLAEGEAMLNRALAKREKTMGPDHMTTLYFLGIAYRDQRRFDEAEATLKRALAGYEKVLGLDHVSTMHTVHTLGTVYIDQQKLAEAEATLKEALTRREKALGPGHALTLDSVHVLGLVYRDQGRLAESVTTLKQALAGREKALGQDHTLTLYTVHVLGTVYLRQGRLSESEARLKRALAGREKTLGPDHPLTLGTTQILGVVYRDQGRLTKAEATFKRALAGREKVLGADHTLTLYTVHFLGSVFLSQGKLAEAEAAAERALAGREKAVGRDHITTLETARLLELIRKKKEAPVVD